MDWNALSADLAIAASFSVLGNNENATLPGPEIDFGIRAISSGTGCTDALGPLPTNGTVTVGSTLGAPRVGPQCLRNYHGPGMWYSFIGTGFRVVVSTCHINTGGRTVISLHSSTMQGSCDIISCVNFNDDICSTLFWNTRVDIVYYVSVLGSNRNGITPGPPRNFGLSVLSTETGCDDSTMLQVDGPMVVFNSTDDGSMIGPQCGKNVFGDGFFFSFSGTAGGRINVDTCFADTSIPHHVAVYMSVDGNCDSLVCVTSAFRTVNECATNSVAVDTVADMQYYISVVGSVGPSTVPGPTGTIAISLIEELP
jgi:hypothetical protein